MTIATRRPSLAMLTPLLVLRSADAPATATSRHARRSTLEAKRHGGFDRARIRAVSSTDGSARLLSFARDRRPSRDSAADARRQRVLSRCRPRIARWKTARERFAWNPTLD